MIYVADLIYYDKAWLLLCYEVVERGFYLLSGKSAPNCNSYLISAEVAGLCLYKEDLVLL